MEKINHNKKTIISIPQRATIPIDISGWSFIHLNRLESLYSMMMVKTLEETPDFLDERHPGEGPLWPFFSLVCVIWSIPLGCLLSAYGLAVISERKHLQCYKGKKRLSILYGPPYKNIYRTIGTGSLIFGPPGVLDTGAFHDRMAQVNGTRMNLHE
ncbi:MAG TPA: hypothetical protein VLM75_04260 [Spirochaetota bacterium]|nr:hypothetical protein [Spirochaetota bacterium]